MKCNRITWFVVALALVSLCSCGGGGTAGTTSSVSLRGSGSLAGQVVRNNEFFADASSTIEGIGTAIQSIESIDDRVDLSCAFSVGTDQVTISGIQIVTDSGDCTSLNKCIVCELGATDGCQISCTGTVPSNAASAADSFDVAFTVVSNFQSDMPAPDGAIRFDSEISDWAEFDPRNGVDFDLSGCDGGDDMTVVPSDSLNDEGLWADIQDAASWSYAYEIYALDPVQPAGLGSCVITTTMTATMSLAGAAAPGETLDLTRGTIVSNSRICDTTNNCPAP